MSKKVKEYNIKLLNKIRKSGATIHNEQSTWKIQNRYFFARCDESRENIYMREELLIYTQKNIRRII